MKFTSFIILLDIYKLKVLAIHWYLLKSIKFIKKKNIYKKILFYRMLLKFMRSLPITKCFQCTWGICFWLKSGFFGTGEKNVKILKTFTEVFFSYHCKKYPAVRTSIFISSPPITVSVHPMTF